MLIEGGLELDPDPEPPAQGAQGGSRDSIDETETDGRNGNVETTADGRRVHGHSGSSRCRLERGRDGQIAGSGELGVITKFPVGFYFILQDGAKAWDKGHAGGTVVFAQGKSATDDAGEIAAVQDMVASGVKGIAIAPTSPAVAKALNKARKQGVKIVLIDNDIPTWHGKASVVATNNFNGEKLAGKFLAAHLKAGDKLGVLAGVPGVPSLDDRVKGMLAGLGALKGKLKIVGNLETDCAQDKGFTAAQTIITANQDLKAMYAACGPPAVGMDQAAKNAHLPNSTVLVGFDA